MKDTPGQMIKAMREKRGFAQWMVAKALGRSQSYVSQFEVGCTEPTERVLTHILGVIALMPSPNEGGENEGTQIP